MNIKSYRVKVQGLEINLQMDKTEAAVFNSAKGGKKQIWKQNCSNGRLIFFLIDLTFQFMCNHENEIFRKQNDRNSRVLWCL